MAAFGRLAARLVLALAAVVLLRPERAVAQQWKELSDVPEDRQARFEVPRMLSDGTIANQALFDGFFKFKAAELTLAKNRGQLHKLRRTVASLARSSRGSARERMLEVLLKEMRAIVADPGFHPAARINALLIIGELNERDVPLGQSDPPVPLPSTVETLLEMADPARPRSGTDDALLLTALVGLERHARTPSGVAGAGNQRRAQEQLMTLAAAGNRPAFRSPEVHAYIRVRAAEVLAAIGQAGVEPGSADVAAALLALTVDDSLPLWARCSVAEALAGIDFRAARDLDVAAAARHLGNLAAEAAENESVRRVLKSRLLGIHALLGGTDAEVSTKGGLTAIGSPEQKAVVGEVAGRVNELVALIDDRNVEDAEYLRKLGELTVALRELVKQNVAAAAPSDGGRVVRTP